MGLGSVGWDILCFLPPLLKLALGSDDMPGNVLEADAVLNHFAGFVKNCVNPKEGDAERGGGGCCEFGDKD